MCDASGAIVLANAAARQYGASLGLQALVGLSLGTLLQGLRDTTGLRPLCTPAQQPRQLPTHSEGRDVQGRHFCCCANPLTAPALAGW